jgi:hypothetical protein
MPETLDQMANQSKVEIVLKIKNKNFNVYFDSVKFFYDSLSGISIQQYIYVDVKKGTGLQKVKK